MSIAPYREISANELLAFENETEIEIFFSNHTYFHQQNGAKGWLSFAVIFEASSENALQYKIRTSKEILRNKDSRYLYPKEYNMPDPTVLGNIRFKLIFTYNLMLKWDLDHTKCGKTIGIYYPILTIFCE